MNKLTDKTMGDVIIVRRPHRFNTTVTWFGSKEDAYEAYELGCHYDYFDNFGEFCKMFDAEADADEIEFARKALKDAGIREDEPFAEIIDFPSASYQARYVREVNLDDMLDEAVGDDMYSGTVFVAEDGETWGEFADRIYENTRGHNEPSMRQILDACWIDEE